MNDFTIGTTSIAGVLVLERRLAGDQRGFLSRIFSASELASAGWHAPIAQVNHTFTRGRGTVRGMHFQRGAHAEQKLVTCIRGTIWDVAVDVRAGSPTFLQWHAEELSQENRRSLLVPEGCAHGFQCLSDECEMIYCHSAAYTPNAEGALHPLDPRLSIAWPAPVVNLSQRDASHPMITDYAGERL